MGKFSREWATRRKNRSKPNKPSARRRRGDIMGNKTLEICPECGRKLVHAGGCVECSSCGFGACG